MKRTLLVLTILACGLAWAAFQSPAITQAAPNDLAANMTACWSLDEASGTRYDSAGTNDLTDNNTVGSAVGVQGNAANYVSANNESLSHTSNTELQMGDIDYTIALWMYRSTLTSQFAITKGGLGAASSEYALSTAANGNWAYTIGNGTTYNTVTKLDNTEGWHLFVFWHDATNNTINLQVNNGTPSSTATTIQPYVNTSNLYVGYAGWTNGNLDEVMFWKNRILTADERTELYNSGAGLSCDDIIIPPTATPTQTPTATPTNTPIPTTATPTPDGNTFYNLTLPSGNVSQVQRVVTFGDIAIATALFVLTAVILIGLVYMGGARQWFR